MRPIPWPSVRRVPVRTTQLWIVCCTHRCTSRGGTGAPDAGGPTKHPGAWMGFTRPKGGQGDFEGIEDSLAFGGEYRGDH